MDEPSRRPWWRKKRALALGFVWLVLAYVGGVGPVGYALGRGWISMTSASIYVAPLEAIDEVPGLRTVTRPLQKYAQWWLGLGERHGL